MMRCFDDYFDYSQEILLEERFVRVEETELHEYHSNITRSVMVIFTTLSLYYLRMIIKKASVNEMRGILLGIIMTFIFW